MIKVKKIKLIIPLSLAVAFGLGLFFGIWLYGGDKSLSDKGSNPEEYHEVRAGGYRLINPLLECDISSDRENLLLEPLKTEVEEFIDRQRAQTGIDMVAVYFRDLNNGPWFGINEKEEFAPASLLKVPMMVAFYKLAEDNPELLDTVITYQGEFDDKTNLDIASETLEAGQDYKIDELINKMIIYSDNKSMKVLQNFLNNRVDKKILLKTAAEIGLISPTATDAGDSVMIKQYAAIFRILYNASYLDKTMSEKALEALSQSDYDIGLAAGIPDNITLANKFGYYNTGSINEEQQLHDCGIVYYSPKPYLICVMTRGGNERLDLETTIQGISRMVFDFVENSKMN